MVKTSPIAIFLAAATLFASNTISSAVSHADEQEMGGLKEWTTDQAIDAESELDSSAKKAAKKAKEKNICIPIGEGENCW